MASKPPILAAGGIVVRDGGRALFAVVQRSKDGAWVLPRGKLKRDEKPVIGARREAVEETGHRVRVYEFLGAITYRAGGRPKVVQFWRMEAEAEASHDLMTDIAAVEWLPLKAAVRRLSYPLEKLFLRNIGRQAMTHRQRGHAGKAGSPDARLVKLTKPHKTARRKPVAPKSAATHSTSAKHTVHKPSSRKHSRNKPSNDRPASVKQHAPKRTAPAAPTPERAFPPSPPQPKTAAGRKSILQRMLGRLAGS